MDYLLEKSRLGQIVELLAGISCFKRGKSSITRPDLSGQLGGHPPSIRLTIRAA
jgi:hypothetical protein